MCTSMNYTFTIYQNEKKGLGVWTSGQWQYKDEDALYLGATLSDQISIVNGTKYNGHPIRPVTSNPNAGGNPIDHSQDYLVTDNVTASFTGGSIYSINGVIQSGSVLNVKFSNGSNESVTLVGIQINDAANGNQGTNALGAEVEVAAGESKSYSITLGTNVRTPVVCFTYRYNSKNYKAEATWDQ